MILFICIAAAAVIGLFVGKVKKRKRLFCASLILLLVDIVLSSIGSILYAIYE